MHGLTYAQTVCHYAASSLCECARARQTFSCPAGDCKCAESFASEAQSCIRRPVLYEDCRIDRFRIFCDIINVLRMDVCGVTVTMLEPYSLLYRIVKILCPYHTENRHHKFCSNQRMFLRSFKCDTSDVVRNCDTNHAKQRFSIASHTFSVQFPVF